MQKFDHLKVCDIILNSYRFDVDMSFIQNENSVNWRITDTILGHLLYNAKAKDIESDIRQLIPQTPKLQNGNDSSVDDSTSLRSSDFSHKSEGPLIKEEIIVIVRRVTMGMGSRNPIERVMTYQL